jgi:hypothetical protein
MLLCIGPPYYALAHPTISWIALILPGPPYNAQGRPTTPWTGWMDEYHITWTYSWDHKILTQNAES